MVRIPEATEAVIFDMDGVVTDTASVHAAAWRQSFDEYLQARSRNTGEPFVPFSADDYRHYVDGKPRYDGVRSFLASRGIHLPEGHPSDPPEAETICGVGNAKNRRFLADLRETGARPYPSTVALVRRLARAGLRTAIISSSRNMRDVLEAADLMDAFDARVDGVIAAELGLRGKPDPAVFLEAARLVGVDRTHAVVVEDALAGVQAGRRGGFAMVIGVDRTGHPEALRRAGADAVVADLAAVELAEPRAYRIDALPAAIDDLPAIRDRLAGRRPAVFLDYDGTLTPIVDDPARAILATPTRLAIERLAAVCPVAVVSGRDLADVRRLVDIDGIWYAGSHGFDIEGPNDERVERAADQLPALETAEVELRRRLTGIDGAWVERKRFAVTAHFRRTPPERIPAVHRAVAAVAAAYPQLRLTGGKMVEELRPSIEWDKGHAVRWLRRVQGLEGSDVIAIYVGDDETDEDAIRALGPRGLGFVVRGERDDRETLAAYAFDGPEDVRGLLEMLARWVGPSGTIGPPGTKPATARRSSEEGAG